MKKILARLVTVAVVWLAFVLGWFAWEHYPRAPGTRDARVRADVRHVVTRFHKTSFTNHVGGTHVGFRC